jgi:hypothetical protein
VVLPPSIASIASSSASSIHFLLPFTIGTLRTFGGLHMV